MEIDFSQGMALLGGVLSMLLSLIAFFLKQLYGSFRKMEGDMEAMKASMQLMKTEQKANYALLRQRMAFLEAKE